MDDPATFSFTYIALLVILALGAVGVILTLKVLRGRQAARSDTDPELDGDAPADPMSQARASRMMNRYKWSAGTIIVLLILAAIVVYSR
jgi:uncharacterized membrane protein YqjE